MLTGIFNAPALNVLPTAKTNEVFNLVTPLLSKCDSEKS
jgi:hypothetical protein